MAADFGGSVASGSGSGCGGASGARYAHFSLLVCGWALCYACLVVSGGVSWLSVWLCSSDVI